MNKLGVLRAAIEDRQIVLRDIPAQHVLPFQKRGKRDMHVIQDVTRLFQIGTAFEVQIARLGHLREIIGDPLMLECCI